MTQLKKIIRKIPSPLALVAYFLLGAACVYFSLRLAIPPEWRWLNVGRHGGRHGADFSSAVALVTGSFFALHFYVWSHGPRHPVGFPRLATGWWVLGFAMIGVVPCIEWATGWSASHSPLAFVTWLISAIAWAMLLYSHGVRHSGSATRSGGSASPQNKAH